MSKTQRVIAHVKSILLTPYAYLTVFFERRPTTDVGRWQSPENLSPDWDERTALIAALVPAGSSVIEFGAARLVLRRHLDPSCSYQPVDLVKRSDDTIVFDLNGALPKLPQQYDVAIFSGVLEYVHDLGRIMEWLPRISRSVIFSYAVTDMLSDPVTRRQNGWVNSFSDKEIRRIVGMAGLDVRSSQPWRQQIIYLCQFPTTPADRGSAV
ncbi:MAG: class I SAM-dependent methyltransferase [Hyphomicrobiales bacterium]|nr:MAG: class I SAM-dependent methyltransferase [Hyphomicrobiales bacterium]